jgi:hypothetical protein
MDGRRRVGKRARSANETTKRIAYSLNKNNLS